MKKIFHLNAYIASISIIVLGLSVQVQGAPKNLLVNGSFENPSNPPAAGAFLTINSGNEATVGFKGWKVSPTGNIDIVDATAPLLGINWGSQAAVNGSQILDLNGDTNGAISQTFPTVAGRSYRLSFSYTNNPLGGTNESALVRIINIGANKKILVTRTIKHTTATLTQPNWTFFAASFTAIGPVTQVVFKSTSKATDPSGGVVLDNVKVVAR